jgi:hypothetical protein
MNNAAEEKPEQEQQQQATEQEKNAKASKEQQHTLDRKNASGLSRELRRNEMIDWRANDALNSATKMAIEAFEKEYTFEDFIREKDEKEGKNKK